MTEDRENIAHDDPWQTWEWRCPDCGWTGSGEGLALEPFEALMELHCPKCHHKFTFVPYPTTDQMYQQAQLFHASQQPTHGKEQRPVSASEVWARIPQLGVGEELITELEDGSQIVITAVATGTVKVATHTPDGTSTGFSSEFGRHELEALTTVLAPMIAAHAVTGIVHVDGAGRRSVIGGQPGSAEVTDGILNRFDVPLRTQVERFMAQTMSCAPADLPRDKDDDLYIVRGSAVVYVRLMESPPALSLFCPAVVDVPPSPDLLMGLADLSMQSPVHWRYASRTVFACMTVLAEPFIGNHLDTALRITGDTATSTIPAIIANYGGRPFYEG